MDNILVQETEILFKDVQGGDRFAARLDVVFHVEGENLTLRDITICKSQDLYKYHLPRR